VQAIEEHEDDLDAIDRIGSQIPQVFAAIDRAGGD